MPNYVTGTTKNTFDEQLVQLLSITHDGDLISKTERDELIKMGFVARTSGFNIITPEGINHLYANKFIHE